MHDKRRRESIFFANVQHGVNSVRADLADLVNCVECSENSGENLPTSAISCPLTRVFRRSRSFFSPSFFFFFPLRYEHFLHSVFFIGVDSQIKTQSNSLKVMEKKKNLLSSGCLETLNRKKKKADQTCHIANTQHLA